MEIQQDWDASMLRAYLLRDYWSLDGGFRILSGFDYSANFGSNLQLWAYTLDPCTLQGHTGYAENVVEELLDIMRDDLDQLYIIWEGCRRDIEAEDYPPAFFIEWALSKHFRPYWLDWAIERGLCIPNQNADKTPLSDVDKASLTYPHELAMVVQTGAPVPGKMPRITIGKFAIKAAWQIESATDKQATANQVIEMLKKWEHNEPVITEVIAHGVKWETTKGIIKSFDVQACAKTLEKWNKSRA